MANVIFADGTTLRTTTRIDNIIKFSVSEENIDLFVYRLIIEYIGKISFNKNIMICMSSRNQLYIYVEKFSIKDVETITEGILNQYISARQAAYNNKKYVISDPELSEDTKEKIKELLSTRFVQYGTKIFEDIKISKICNQYDSKTETCIESKLYKPERLEFKIEAIKKIDTSVRELLNFVCLYWHITDRKKYKDFTNYLAGLLYPEYGSSIGLPSNLKYKFNNLIEKDSNFLNLDADQKIFLLNCFYMNNIYETENKNTIIRKRSAEFTWIQSSFLTSSEILKKNIFTQGSDYNFYSESSQVYKDIFGKFYQKINLSKNTLDAYLRQMDINKFFISDVLVIKKGSNIVNVLKKVINSYDTIKEWQFRKIVKIMDVAFEKGEFIPISLKKIELSNVDRPELVENISGSKVKIINSPKKYNNPNYDIDDLDYLVLKMLNDVKTKSLSIDQILRGDDYMKIDYSSFIYDSLYKDMSYGRFATASPYHLRFEFTVSLKEGKSRRYSFEIRGSAVFVRTVGTASATGEGSISPSSLNYVMKEVYSGKYNKQLQNLVTIRLSIFNNLKNKFFEDKNIDRTSYGYARAIRLLNDFEKILLDKKILNQSSYDKHSQVFNQIKVVTKDDRDKDGGIVLETKKLCIEIFQAYLNLAAKSLGKTAKNKTALIGDKNADLSKDLMNLKNLTKKQKEFLQKVQKLVSDRETRNLMNNQSKIREALEKLSDLGETDPKIKELNVNLKKTVEDIDIILTKISNEFRSITGIFWSASLNTICGYELGLILEKDVQVSGNNVSVKFNLKEEDKKRLILTEWGLISARGAIVFENTRFINATQIQDVLRYGIKMPALLKIGV